MVLALATQNSQAQLNDGDNESAVLWASLARTHAILASAAATARRAGDLGMTRDCGQQAVRQLNLAHCYELIPLEAVGSAAAPLP